jgi:hypothetical protein
MSHTLDKDDDMISEKGNGVLTCEFVGGFLQTVPSDAMEGRVEVRLTSREMMRCGS